MRWLFSPRGLSTWGLFLAAVLGPTLVVAVIAMQILNSQDMSLPDASPLTQILTVMGVLLGGHLNAAGTMTLTIPVTGLLLACLLLIRLVARWRAPQDSGAWHLGPVAVRSLVEAAGVGVIAVLLTGITSIRIPDADLFFSDDGGSSSIRSSVPLIFLFVVLITMAGSLSGRWAARPQLVVPSWMARWRWLGAELGAVVGVLGVVLGVGCLVLVLTTIPDEGWWPVGAALVLLPAVAAWGLSIGTVGGVTVSGRGSGSWDSETVQAWSGDARLWMVVLVAVIALLAASVRVGVRRPRAVGIVWQRVWQLPVLTFVLWPLIMAWLASGSYTMSLWVLGEGSVKAAPAFLTLLTVPLALALVSVLAELLPLFLYHSAHGLLVLLGGSRQTAAWAAGPTAAVPVPAPSPTAPLPVAPVAAASGASLPPGPPLPPAPSASSSIGSRAGAAVSGPGVWSPSMASPYVAVPAAQAISPEGGMTSPGFLAPPSAAVPQAVLAPLGAPQPISAGARRRVRIGLIAAGVAVLAVIGVSVAVNVLNSSRTPEAAVREYVDLIAGGHADAATAMVDPGVPNDQRVLLTDASMSGSTGTMTVEEVTASDSQKDDTVSVTVVYQVDGSRNEAQLEVSRQPNSMLFLHEWKVTSALTTPVTIYTTGLTTVNVGSAVVTLPDSDPSYAGGEENSMASSRTAELYAYPGVYTVSAPEDLTSYATVDDTTLTAEGSGGSNKVSVEAEPSDDLKAAVLEAVTSAVDSCGSVPGNMDDTCPYSVRSSDLQSVQVTTELTTIEALSLTSFTSGRATITIQRNATSWMPNPEKEDITFVMRGSITFDDKGEPEITVTDSSTWY